MREIILKKRYPHSREEDITDAFMRGYETGKADRPQGEWIRQEAQHKEDKTVLDCRVCSECGAGYVIHNNIKDLDTDPPNFCPNCGADMREREGE